MNNDEFKICPFCKEKIRISAIKCRYCAEWLEVPPAEITHKPPDAPEAVDTTPIMPAESTAQTPLPHSQPVTREEMDAGHTPEPSSLSSPPRTGDEKYMPLEMREEPGQSSSVTDYVQHQLEKITGMETPSPSVPHVPKASNDFPLKHPQAPQVRWGRCLVGIIGTILLLAGIGTKIVENRTAKRIVSNHKLLQDIGKDPADYAGIPVRLDDELVFLTAVATVLSGYVLAVILKRRKLALVLLCIAIVLFLIVRLDSIFSLTEEERTRGFTAGGWVAKVGRDLVPFALEMVILSQGWVGLRPRRDRVTPEPSPEIRAASDLQSC